MKKKIIVSLFLGLSTAANVSYAEDVYDLPKVVSVSQKDYSIKHDFTLLGGFLPSDAFNKGYTAGFSYTYFFNSYMGWEIINGNYNFNSATSLKDDINSIPRVQLVNSGVDDYLDYINYYVTTNFVYTPVYSKNLMFNENIIHGDTSFVFGGGVVSFENAGIQFLVSAGIVLRFFSSKNSSWKFDFRNNLYMREDAGVVNSWSFSIGYSFLSNQANQVDSLPIDEGV